MAERITLPIRHEYDITVENLTLRLLITRLLSRSEAELSIIGMHTHAYFELFVCTEGRITIETQNGAHDLAAGMLAIVPSGISHICRCPQGSKFFSLGLLITRRRISGTKNLYAALARLLSGSSVRILTPDPDSISDLARIGMNAGANDIRTPISMLNALVALSAERSLPTAGHGDINRIAQLEHLIEANYQQDMTLEAAAARLFLSKSQFVRIVRARYGTSFHKIILERRLDAAKKLLCESAMSVEQIGASVGFQSKSSFYRAFRAAYGMTPAEYRADKQDPL